MYSEVKMEEKQQDIYDDFFINTNKSSCYFDTTENLIINDDKDIVENNFKITDYGLCKTFFYVFLQYKLIYKDIIDTEVILEQITDSIENQKDFKLRINEEYSFLIHSMPVLENKPISSMELTLEKYEIMADLAKISDVEINNLISLFEYNYSLESKFEDILKNKEKFEKIKLYKFIMENNMPYVRARQYLNKAKSLCCLMNEQLKIPVSNFIVRPEDLPLPTMCYYLTLFYVKMFYCHKKKKCFQKWV